MKQPTITEICNLLHEYERLDPIDRGVHSLALKIHWLYNPSLKPLSELHLDREACEKIAEFMCFNSVRVRKGDFDTTVIEGAIHDDAHKLIIWPDGDIFLQIAGEDQVMQLVFPVVKLILSLGYDVQPETKTP